MPHLLIQLHSWWRNTVHQYKISSGPSATAIICLIISWWMFYPPVKFIILRISRGQPRNKPEWCKKTISLTGSKSPKLQHQLVSLFSFNICFILQWGKLQIENLHVICPQGFFSLPTILGVVTWPRPVYFHSRFSSGLIVFVRINQVV